MMHKELVAVLVSRTEAAPGQPGSAHCNALHADELSPCPLICCATDILAIARLTYSLTHTYTHSVTNSGSFLFTSLLTSSSGASSPTSGPRCAALSVGPARSLHLCRCWLAMSWWYLAAHSG